MMNNCNKNGKIINGLAVLLSFNKRKKPLNAKMQLKSLHKNITETYSVYQPMPKHGIDNNMPNKAFLIKNVTLTAFLSYNVIYN